MPIQLPPRLPVPQANSFVPRRLTTRSNNAVGSMTSRGLDLFRPYPNPGLNESDICLAYEREAWGHLVEGVGLKQLCCPKGRKPYKNRPWVDMPKEGRRFRPIGSVPVASLLFDGSNQLILSERVPLGYDGVISDVVCEVVAPGGTGFVEGSGDITWRLAADNRYLRDQGNMIVSIGSLTQPSPVPRGGLLVYSHNLINFYVALASGAEDRINPLARIVCSISGWWWPR